MALGRNEKEGEGETRTTSPRSGRGHTQPLFSSFDSSNTPPLNSSGTPFFSRPFRLISRLYGVGVLIKRRGLDGIGLVWFGLVWSGLALDSIGSDWIRSSFFILRWAYKEHDGAMRCALFFLLPIYLLPPPLSVLQWVFLLSSSWRSQWEMVFCVHGRSRREES